MRIPQGHGDGFVSHQLLHRANVHSRHDQTRGKGVSKVMKLKILQVARLTVFSKDQANESGSGSPWRLQKRTGEPFAFASLTSLRSISSSKVVIGTERPSPFFAYPALTLTSPRVKSTSSGRRAEEFVAPKAGMQSRYDESWR